MPLPPEFIAMDPLLMNLPEASPREMPLLKKSEFNIVICPPESLVRMRRTPIPVVRGGLFATSVVPDGTISSSLAATRPPPLLSVHVLVPPFHVPLYVGHEVPSSMMVAALAS